MAPLGRRRLAALPLLAILRPRPAGAAEFTYKFAKNLPDSHPLNVRMRQAAARIAEASNGRFELRIFPSSQLGSDTDTLSQVRSGAVEFFNLSGLILSTLVPVAAINGVGFAFADYGAVWTAMDGKLGAHVRDQVARRGLLTMPRMFDNGFRQITTSNKPITAPDDLRGVKLRVPVSALWTSLFTTLGAASTSINFSEVYSALQTHLVDGEENPLAVIYTAKLYEVQTFCARSNHMWDGFWLLANRRAWERLPSELQTILTKEFDRAATEERADVAALNAGLQTTLATAGLRFNDIDPAAFRARLQGAGFYRQWRAKFGDEAWSLLEAATGNLG